LSKVANLIAALTAAVFLGGMQSAEAQVGIAIGELTCAVKAGESFIFGSTKDLHCIFRATANGPSFRYAGAIKKFGLDIGVSGNAQLTWTVFAPTDRFDPVTLAGSNSGVTAGAAVGIGAGANVLIGGSNNTISLQPMSVTQETGLNAAAAVASVQLYRDGEELLK
jgi:hypothetical protein